MLFDPIQIRTLSLANRSVMSPMTRSRAVEANTPNALMADYYGQRASAGLIRPRSRPTAPRMAMPPWPRRSRRARRP